MLENPIEKDIEESISEDEQNKAVGPIAKVARTYASDSGNLLGFLLSLNYENLSIVTCDPWKRKCGGVPRNSFVTIKLSPIAVDKEDQPFCDRIILARVTDSVPTPVERDIQGTIFQVHKVQALLDPITQKELQWSALKASVVGTYYDVLEGDSYKIAFGNDVDTFFAPHAYEVYVPSADDLELLMNSFVICESPLGIGQLRYTETPTLLGNETVSINVDPLDFVGRDYGHRTALFGKTRFGKSNTIKVIADTILSSNIRTGQVIFDPSGEYTYYNSQDNTSLYAIHSEKCVRYSLNPREIEYEKRQNFPIPNILRINFYESVSVGHSLIQQLWDSQHQNRPGYLLPILNWFPPDLRESPPPDNRSEFNHFWRTMSLWFAVLRLAGFLPTKDFLVPVDFRAHVKDSLVNEPGLGNSLKKDGNGRLAKRQSIDVLPAMYKKIAALYAEHKGMDVWFPNSSRDGSPYFNDVESAMLRILEDAPNLLGKRYFVPFRVYHDPAGSNIFDEISKHAQNGKTVLIDFAKANEEVRINLSERICRYILGDMMSLFAEDKLEGKFIIFYFEEAHTLFRQDDRDLNNVYNKLAKEGAKFNISMVYATQSMTTLSPDLLKNTENIFIAHLDDDREVREATRKYAFRDVADDVQRTMSKGFVRMITLSHRFALPVQIRKFEPKS